VSRPLALVVGAVLVGAISAGLGSLLLWQLALQPRDDGVEELGRAVALQALVRADLDSLPPRSAVSPTDAAAVAAARRLWEKGSEKLADGKYEEAAALFLDASNLAARSAMLDAEFVFRRVSSGRPVPER
jgi:hypothetical protein